MSSTQMKMPMMTTQAITTSVLFVVCSRVGQTILRHSLFNSRNHLPIRAKRPGFSLWFLQPLSYFLSLTSFRGEACMLPAETAVLLFISDDPDHSSCSSLCHSFSALHSVQASVIFTRIDNGTSFLISRFVSVSPVTRLEANCLLPLSAFRRQLFRHTKNRRKKNLYRCF